MNPNHTDNPMPDDHRFNKLLDEALSPRSVPGGLPDDLADRIMRQTADRLAPDQVRGVLGRIGPMRLSALAAAIIITAVIGLTLIQRNEIQSSTLQQELAVIVDYEQYVDDLDEAMERLTMQINQLDIIDRWNGQSSSLEFFLEFDVSAGSGM